MPPDRVILNVGASFRTEPMLSAGARLLALAKNDRASLAHVGLAEDAPETLEAQLAELRVIFKDPRAKKNDTPLPMSEVAETMARVRGWLLTLRRIGMVNLALDTPALARVASPAPELAEGYARDLLAELELRLDGARDLKPRLETCGLSDSFLNRGRALGRQLRTAIGQQDLDAANLHFTLRRLYMRKGDAYLLLKRITRAGQLVFAEQPERANLYHIAELEPEVREPFDAKVPKPSRR